MGFYFSTSIRQILPVIGPERNMGLTPFDGKEKNYHRIELRALLLDSLKYYTNVCAALLNYSYYKVSRVGEFNRPGIAAKYSFEECLFETEAKKPRTSFRERLLIFYSFNYQYNGVDFKRGTPFLRLNKVSNTIFQK